MWARMSTTNPERHRGHQREQLWDALGVWFPRSTHAVGGRSDRGAVGMTQWSRGSGHFQESARRLQAKRWEQSHMSRWRREAFGKVDWDQIAKDLKFQTKKCVFNSSENRKKLKGYFFKFYLNRRN